MRVGAGAVERGADIGADRAGAENCDFHGEGAPFGRGIPRRWRTAEFCRRNIVYSMEVDPARVRASGSHKL
jgi:hypothetical protein